MQNRLISMESFFYSEDEMAVALIHEFNLSLAKAKEVVRNFKGL